MRHFPLLHNIQSFTLADTIGCFLDLDQGAISFSKNGKAISSGDELNRAINVTINEGINEDFIVIAMFRRE